MTSLYETLKQDRIQAMKNRQTLERDLLSTLVGQIELESSKNIKYVPKSDEHVIAVLKKFIDDCKFNIQQNDSKIDIYTQELSVLEKYLPSQLNEDQIQTIIRSTFDNLEAKDKGRVMKFFKDNHSGLYDGKLVSSVFEKLCSI